MALRLSYFLFFLLCSSVFVAAAQHLGSSSIFGGSSEEDSLLKEIASQKEDADDFSRISLTDDLLQQQDEVEIVEEEDAFSSLYLEQPERVDEDFDEALSEINEPADRIIDTPGLNRVVAQKSEDRPLGPGLGTRTEKKPLETARVSKEEVRPATSQKKVVTREETDEKQVLGDEVAETSRSRLKDFMEEEEEPSLLRESFTQKVTSKPERSVEPTMRRLEFLKSRGSSLVQDDVRTLYENTRDAVVIQKSKIPIKRSKTVEHTKISIVIRPKKILYDFTVYEDIPKSVARDVSEITFSDAAFVVLEADPLVAWQFAILDRPITISYTVAKKIDQLPSTVVAAGLVTNQIAEYKSPPKGIVPFLLIVFGFVLLGIISLFVVHQRRSVKKMFEAL